MRTLFANVPDEEKDNLFRTFFSPAISVRAPRRAPTEVDLGGRFSIVTKGAVAAVHEPLPLARGASMRLYVFVEGDFLGEIAAFYGTLQTAGLQTRTGVEIWSLKCKGDTAEQRSASQEESLLRLLQACPQVGLNVAAEMSWRLMRTVRYRASNAEDRIRYAVAFRELERAGHRSRVRDKFMLPSRDDLAAETGMNIRSVDRALPKLEKKEIIERTGEDREGWYKVVSWEALTSGLYL